MFSIWQFSRRIVKRKYGIAIIYQVISLKNIARIGFGIDYSFLLFMFTSLSIQAPYVFMRVFTDVKVNDLSMCRPKGVAPYQISTTSCLTKMQLLQDCSCPLH